MIRHTAQALWVSLDSYLHRFRRDEDGVTAVEYGLIAALVAVAIIGAVFLLGQALDGTFTTIGNEVNNPTGGAGAGG